MAGSGWKLYLVCELESGSGQLFEFNQKKQAQSGLSYLRTRKLHGTRQSHPRPSSRVSRTWEEVLTLSSQVHPYSTFLIDKGRAPARPALHVWKPLQPLMLIPAFYALVHVLWTREAGRAGAHLPRYTHRQLHGAQIRTWGASPREQTN